MSSNFKFKQFEVAHDRCAMKIGTDGVLLGAWTPLDNNPQNVLDIGAGSGIIALQLAQRSMAQEIDAVEIDDAAYEQCTENFENSPWADRLFCYHASIQEFASEMDEAYDLIVSNPPFYSEDFKTENSSRDLARFNEAMPFQHLAVSASHLLSDDGVFALIIPYKEEESFISIAAQYELLPFRICNIRGNTETSFKRSLIAFSFQKKEIELTELTIENSRHDYTDAYVDLVKDFYLKM